MTAFASIISLCVTAIIDIHNYYMRYDVTSSYLLIFSCVFFSALYVAVLQLNTVIQDDLDDSNHEVFLLDVAMLYSSIVWATTKYTQVRFMRGICYVRMFVMTGFRHSIRSYSIDRAQQVTLITVLTALFISNHSNRPQRTLLNHVKATRPTIWNILNHKLSTFSIPTTFHSSLKLEGYRAVSAYYLVHLRPSVSYKRSEVARAIAKAKYISERASRRHLATTSPDRSREAKRTSIVFMNIFSVKPYGNASIPLIRSELTMDNKRFSPWARKMAFNLPVEQMFNIKTAERYRNRKHVMLPRSKNVLSRATKLQSISKTRTTSGRK